MFPDPDHKESLKPRIKRLVEIKAAYQRVAATTEQVYYHDLARSLRPKESTDGVHPNTAGHQRLAHFFHDILTHEIGTRANCGEISRKRSVWNGFDRHDFQLPKTGASATLVIPHTAAQGQPWIWRARFFGHQPALDLALLDRGYHLAYVDVSNLFGSDAAMQRCDEFYHLLTSKFNLNTSSIMEGMSRGGLMIFNYAARYPDRVSAIYGDNPVCDFKSWPGGQNGQLSKANWKRCLEVYGITAEQAASHPQISDASFASKLGNIPVALVIGTADEVVPPAENGLLLAKHLKGNNNPPKIWTKPGAGHHPHGLDPVEPLLRFLLQADGYGE